jgi:ribonuclease Z
MPLLGFTGDTSPEGLDNNPDLYEAKVLITEMSFIAPNHRKDKIHKHGHMHLDDFVERQDRFHNELIVAAHFSTRYHDKQIQHYVRKNLPGMIGGRLHLWL